MSAPEIIISADVGKVANILNSDRARNRVMKIIAARYRSAMQRRFTTFSRGGGDWKALKPSTVKRRRQSAKIRNTEEQKKIKNKFGPAAILIDTGILRSGLNTQLSNAGKETISSRPDEMAVTIAFSGRMHPESAGPKVMTISRLAAIHHFGAPSRGLPARPILVDPDEDTIRAIDAIIDKEASR